LAGIAYVGKDTAGAHAMIDAVIKREPSNLQALLVKAEWLTNESKPAEALKYAETAVKAAPNSAGAHFALGTIQERLRQRKEAIGQYNEVIRLNPRATAAQVALSRLNLAEGAPGSAVTFAESAVTTAPNSPAARLALVHALLGNRDFNRAERELAPLLQKYPNEARVHAVNGSVLMLKSDLKG